MAEIIRMPQQKQPRLYALLWAVMADPSLPPTAKCLFSVLILKHLNRETARCNPSIALVAREIGASRRTVFRAIDDLKAAGWIALVGTKGGASANTNQYVFPHLSNPNAPMTGDKTVTPTGDRNDTPTGDKFVARGVTCDTGRVSDVAHELSIEPSKNYSGASADAHDGDERAPCQMPSDVLDWLRKKLGNDVVASWFAKLTVAEVANSSVDLNAPSKFVATTITSKFDAPLLDAWRSVRSGVERVNVRAAPAAGGAR